MGLQKQLLNDGRCISLLKVMLTNYCMYDCAYCINRRTNDIKRATLSVSELEEITMEFYRRNYIEGLFLSSGVVRNPEFFPVDINSASYEEILRVPGIGVKSAVLIVNSRRFNRITSYHLKKMGVVMKKAKYFITCGELTSSFSQPIIGINELRPERLRPLLLSKAQQKRAADEQQLLLDFKE